MGWVFPASQRLCGRFASGGGARRGRLSRRDAEGGRTVAVLVVQLPRTVSREAARLREGGFPPLFDLPIPTRVLK